MHYVQTFAFVSDCVIFLAFRTKSYRVPQLAYTQRLRKANFRVHFNRGSKRTLVPKPPPIPRMEPCVDCKVSVTIARGTACRRIGNPRCDLNITTTSPHRLVLLFVPLVSSFAFVPLCAHDSRSDAPPCTALLVPLASRTSRLTTPSLPRTC